jgi:putative endopeptidase
MQSTVVYLFYLFPFFIIPVYGQSFFNVNDLDRSIRPTDDFFTFVNGKWVNQTIIPSSQTEWGGVFTMTYNTLLQLKGILDELTRNATSESPHPVDSVSRQLSDLYLAGLDVQTIEQVGIEPLRKTLIQLHKINTYQELIMFVLNWYKQTNQGLIFDFDVASDERNSSVNMVIWRVIETQRKKTSNRNNPLFI